jgi:hypothetical protein
MLESPPLNEIVEACRVDGMPPLPPGGYGALLMLLRVTLENMALDEFRGAEPMLERPPLNVIVEACRVEGMLLLGGYDALLMVSKLILFVLIELVLRAPVRKLFAVKV